MNEGGGGDHIQIGVLKPDGSEFKPIAVPNLLYLTRPPSAELPAAQMELSTCATWSYTSAQKQHCAFDTLALVEFALPTWADTFPPDYITATGGIDCQPFGSVNTTAYKRRFSLGCIFTPVLCCRG